MFACLQLFPCLTQPTWLWTSPKRKIELNNWWWISTIRVNQQLEALAVAFQFIHSCLWHCYVNIMYIILSEILLFWGHFESNIQYFWLRMEEEEWKMENWGWLKEIWGWRMENWGLKLKNWGWRAVNWWWTIKIWGFHHSTPTFNTHIFSHTMSQIMLFWGHCKYLNYPLEDILQLFQLCIAFDNALMICLKN